MCFWNIRVLFSTSIAYVQGHNFIITMETKLFDSIMNIIPKAMLTLYSCLGLYKIDY